MTEEELPLSEKVKKFYDGVYYEREELRDKDFKYKIFIQNLQYNVTQECYRDQLVSFFQMYPLVKNSVPNIEDADYIIYANPFARIEDFTDDVLNDLEFINSERKDNAEIIIVGKAVNIKDIIGDKYKNITYVDSHYTEYLGRRFGLDMKEEYFVYDDRYKQLNIWPVDGCLNKCAFCRRTYMNIPFESLPLEYLKERLDYFKKYHKDQMKFVSLRAENLTEYGLDIYGEQRLHEVINLLNSYDEIERISLPIGMCIGEITDDILESLCNCDKICHIYLNLEAGSNRLLKVIGKKHTNERALEICNRIVEAHPNIDLETTVMLGLPTEGLEDILELSKMILNCKFTYVHCNYYGHSPKNQLDKYPQISEKIRELHLAYLIKELKKNFHNEKILTMRHERIEDTSKRSTLRRLQKIKEEQKYTLPRVLDIVFENFVGDNVSIKTYRKNQIHKIVEEGRGEEIKAKILREKEISKHAEERYKILKKKKY